MHSDFSDGWYGPRPRCTIHGFRFRNEVEDAHNVVARLEQGWAWSSGSRWHLELVPDYFATVWRGKATGYPHCCDNPRRKNQRYACCGGYASCFPGDVLTYHRVCQAGLLGISLAPPEHKVSQGPSCWRAVVNEEFDHPRYICLSPLMLR
eukprot:gnl/TRDRNA2_/TRDRNA2_155757_c2_seq2.p1 gnl/TRDRNA2_/TRDRNA2_155757_c2~~gnl/TRDRNA2_/TRDRNA2_155757_c2_seq2.p1  ORF type:complete len:150 (+),score=2.63 gnl/TRDRNA2_/TRDRNA2_155757_c2_seq2:138-587(+)